MYLSICMCSHPLSHSSLEILFKWRASSLAYSAAQIFVKALSHSTYSSPSSSPSLRFLPYQPPKTMTPGASSMSSDVIHPTVLGSLYGWCITLTTHVSISGLRNSISRLILLSELLELPISRRNIDVGVYAQPRRLSLQDLTASLHTIYGFLTGSLLALIAIKYQGSNTNPFVEHHILMMLFLIAISVFGFAVTITLRRSNNEHSTNKLMVGVSHICGVLACELLLLVLVSPIQSLLINVSIPTLIVILALCYKYALHLLHAQRTEEDASQVADLEAPATSAA